MGWVFVGNATSGYARMHKHGKMQASAPIYGIYDTEHFVLNGDTIAPLSTEPRRWKQLITEFPDHIHIKHMNDSVTYYPVYWEASNQKMVISPGRSEEHTSELQSLMRISYAVLCLKKKKHTDDSIKIHRNNMNTKEM